MYKRLFKKQINKTGGFTLVETLVAISIVSIVVIGTFTAVQQSLSTSMFARDQVAAFYLVEDAMEYIRNVRDTNSIYSLQSTPYGTTVNWLNGLAATPTDNCYFGKVCGIDSYLKTTFTCTGSGGYTCPPLNQNINNGIYGYTNSSGWTTTRFIRYIQFIQVNSHEVDVYVSVGWTSGGVNKLITVRQSLFDIH